MTNWHERFLGLAQHIATFSKDPSTKVGAVIADQHHRIVSMGYNGFPRGVQDTPERLTNRETKYEMVVHAEINAILFAQCDLSQMTLYTYPFPPCSRCAALIINSGLRTVLAPVVTEERWKASCALAVDMFSEAGVQFIQL